MFSASDIANFLACQHLTALDQAEQAGQIRRPYFHDLSVELLKQLGLEHERKYLSQLYEEQSLEIVEIPPGLSREEAAERTVEAMRSGASVIYQATFHQAPWIGHADFLVRVDRSSALGTWSYEVVETKLARSTKARALIQLCFYSDLLSKIQGVMPEWMHVVLGGGASPEKFQVSHYIAYFRKIRREFEQACSNIAPNTYPEPVEHCDVCSWYPLCDQRRRDDDHLCLVAGITRNQRKALVGRSLDTVARLAKLALPASPRFERIGDAALERIREQARLQVEGREQELLIYELLEPVEEGKGLAALPMPSPGDLFIDFEGDPYALEQGLEYLSGIATAPKTAGAKSEYQALWALNRTDEKAAFEKLVALVMECWRQHPDMHVYHYAPYEPTAVKHLAGRHGVCAEEVDQLLRAGIFVDLYRVVRQGLRASVESYSIKRLETIYGFTRSVLLRDATTALQSFEAVLALGASDKAAQGLLETIEGYNRDDCFSTLRLREWLEECRRELETKRGAALPRPALGSGEPSPELGERLAEVGAIADRLVADLSPDESTWTDEQRARWLLAQMLEWHRREEKSAWWEYFRLCELSDEELQEDRSALGGLTYLGEAGRVKRSLIHRYLFPPQEHAIDRALEVRDPKTQKGAGTVVSINDRKGTIDIKRGVSSEVPHPSALIPFDIVDSKVKRESLLRLGAWVAEHGTMGPGQFQAARDLLLRCAPRLQGTVTGPLVRLNEPLLVAAKRLALSLEASVLPVQGPPGSGKTYTGARMIVALVNAGKRVGITAVSHKVISNLLGEVCKVAREEGVSLHVIQKTNEDDGCEETMVSQTDDNREVRDAIARGETQVAAGTAWLWSRSEMAESVDVLFVDEAGQMSLADVLAVSQAAKSLVLLGDPQQLDQPQRGVHPPGADVSALAHILGGAPTIADDRGLFLDETWRLHPDVCAFTSELFYENRLKSRPENGHQRLNCPGSLDGTGLRFVPVNHTGNQGESPEEVLKVASLVEELLREPSTWTDKENTTQRLRLNDILIVAPYNLHVSALAERLPNGARVGTVDKFQGQQAPVVIYSMATSTPEDAPRGMEFLYSLNRLNVATSRAQCVTVLVASPALFNVQCKAPRQMELANAFCRYLEMARFLPPILNHSHLC